MALCDRQHLAWPPWPIESPQTNVRRIPPCIFQKRKAAIPTFLFLFVHLLTLFAPQISALLTVERRGNTARDAGGKCHPIDEDSAESGSVWPGTGARCGGPYR